MSRPHIKIENGAWHCKDDNWKISFGATSPFAAYCQWAIVNFKPVPAKYFNIDKKEDE